MRRRTIAIAALLTLLLAAVPAATRADATGKQGRLAQVRYIVHGLGVQPPHRRLHRGKRGSPLFQQYHLQTKAKQRASVAFRDSTILYLNQRTDAILTNPHVTRVRGGEVDEVHPPGTNHTVTTASAIATAIGTNFDVRVRGKRSTFIVVSGSLLVKNARGQVMVSKNQETTVRPNQPPTPPAPVDADAAIGWTVPLSSGGWQALKTSPDFAPKGIGIDSQGNIYASDYSKDRVVKFSAAGKQVLAWGSKGTGPGQFDAPWGVAVDSHDNVYVSADSAIQKFSSTGQFLSEVGTRGVPGVDPGTFFSPDGLTVDTQDNLYVADQGNDRIQKLSSSLQPLAVFGSLGASPGLSEPEGVAVDRAGTIYIADTLNNRIATISPTGTPLASWGTKGTLLDQLNLPVSIAVDAAGNVFVADELNNRIVEFGPNGDPLTSWGVLGNGVGQFDQPDAVTIDRHGTLYVADSHRIQKLPGAAVGSG